MKPHTCGLEPGGVGYEAAPELCAACQEPCPICETRHLFHCDLMMVQGLARLTPQQYFEWVDGLSEIDQ